MKLAVNLLYFIIINLLVLIIILINIAGHKRSMSICFMYVAFGIAELFIWPLSLATNNWR